MFVLKLSGIQSTFVSEQLEFSLQLHNFEPLILQSEKIILVQLNAK